MSKNMMKDRSITVRRCKTGFIAEEVDNSTWEEDRSWAYSSSAELAVFIEEWANGKYKIQPENELDEVEEA